MKIIFLLPGLGRNVPIGGFKVVYEYANLLTADGFDIEIAYLTGLYVSRKNCLGYLYALLKCGYKHIVGFSGRSWFPLSKKIKESCSLHLDYDAKSDLSSDTKYIATSLSTVDELNKLPIKDDNKFYFIQGYDSYDITQSVIDTYHYPMKKIVVSKALRDMLLGIGEESVYIPNGFDKNCFYLTKKIESRSRYHVSMMYSKLPIKGAQYGIEALKMVSSEEPLLEVTIFGTGKRPKNLPSHFHYIQQPDKDRHLKLNNDNAIFVATSIREGWGLTVGEAMLCGQAVVCTDNGGHREVAQHGRNALMVPVKDSKSLANAILTLIRNDELRHRLAYQGMEDAGIYEWDSSYKLLKRCLLERC